MVRAGPETRFVDETTTGRTNKRLRSFAKIGIAARWPSSAETTWLDKICARLHQGVEPKSELVFRSAILDHAIADQLQALSCATVVIVDLTHYLRVLVRKLAQVFRARIDPEAAAWEILEKGTLTRAAADQIISNARRAAIESSVLPEVERLVSQAAQIAGLSPSPAIRLVDRDQLNDMTPRQLNEFVGRFAAALGDALQPTRLADAITEASAFQRFVTPGQVAYRVLEETTADSVVFDHGDLTVFRAVQDGHVKILDELQRGRPSGCLLRGGVLSEEDSRRVRELQAADLAAARARDLFESAFPETEDAAAAVRHRFAAVLLNTDWI